MINSATLGPLRRDWAITPWLENGGYCPVVGHIIVLGELDRLLSG